MSSFIVFADRLGVPSPHSASALAPRRLGITRWQTHSWAKPITLLGDEDLASQQPRFPPRPGSIP